MKKTVSILAFFIITCSLLNAQEKSLVNESKEAFDSRMKWFQNANYGMFIHFGLYSQLGGVWKGEIIKNDYAEWIQANADISTTEYAFLTDSFNPENFDADYIVKIAKKAGMKYLVITTKHHEGFCLWDSKYTTFDIANTPFKRDILAELSAACRKYNIKFGTYYSIIDWHHSSQERNTEGKDGWSRWGNIRMKPERKEEYITYMKNQIKELIVNYDTDLLWFDGDWVAWWDTKTGIELYNYIRELKPSIIINNRVAKREIFKKDFGTPEQEHPDVIPNYYWEACYTLNNTWGFKNNDTDWKKATDVYDKLMDINKKGGNLLLNIGPDGNGNIPKESVEILLKVGELLKNKD